MPIIVGTDSTGKNLYISDEIIILGVGPFQKEYKFCIFHHGKVIGFGKAGQIKIKVYNLNIEIEIACSYVKRVDLEQEKGRIFYI